MLLFRLFRSSLCETKGRTRKRGTVQLARARDPPRANVSKRMATRQAVHARNCTTFALRLPFRLPPPEHPKKEGSFLAYCARKGGFSSSWRCSRWPWVLLG